MSKKKNRDNSPADKLIDSLMEDIQDIHPSVSSEEENSSIESKDTVKVPNSETVVRASKSEKEKAEIQGHKEFDFNGHKIYALNQKNADKKARKLGLL